MRADTIATPTAQFSESSSTLEFSTRSISLISPASVIPDFASHLPSGAISLAIWFASSLGLPNVGSSTGERQNPAPSTGWCLLTIPSSSLFAAKPPPPVTINEISKKVQSTPMQNLWFITVDDLRPQLGCDLVIHAETQHRRFGSAGHVRPPQEYQRKYSIAGDAKNDSTVIALSSHCPGSSMQTSPRCRPHPSGIAASHFSRAASGNRAWINCINRFLTAPTHSANLQFSL